MNATTKIHPRVTSVSRSHVVVEVPETQEIDRDDSRRRFGGLRHEEVSVPKRISWDQLRDAARQDDAELRAVYGGLLDAAERMAATGELYVRVVLCESGVGHRVRVDDAAGIDHLFSEPGLRRADEGCDHHGGGIGNDGYTFARQEAEAIFARLGARAYPAIQG